MDAATVAESLRSEATRVATLDALEALAPPIPSAVALAAAPALVDAMATEKERASLDRCGQLLARLLAEAAPDPAPVWGAAVGSIGSSERLEQFWAPGLVADALQRAQSGEPLTREDARSFACCGVDGAVNVVGMTAPYSAAGISMVEYYSLVSFLP